MRTDRKITELPPSGSEVTFTGMRNIRKPLGGWIRQRGSLSGVLKRVSEKKGFPDVTEANLHPDSILEVNAYEHYGVSGWIMPMPIRTGWC